MGRWVHVALVAGALVVASACGAEVFQCADDNQCAGAGPGAACEPNGYCSVPDDSCASGRRYGEFAGSALSGACVEPDSGGSAASGSTSGSMSGSTGSSSSSSSTGTNTTSSTTSTTTDSTSTSTTAVDPGSSTSGEVDPSTGSSGTGSTIQTIDIEASIAACTDPTNNDVVLCEATTMTDGFTVDQSNSALMMLETTGFVAFDLDTVPAGAQLLSATLQLTATDGVSADAPSSGEVWKTESFTLTTLAVGQPALASQSAIAPDQGAVIQNQTVEWALPVDELDVSEPLHLAIVPLTEMGVDYWNTDGAVPPRLVLTVMPAG